MSEPRDIKFTRSESLIRVLSTHSIITLELFAEIEASHALREIGPLSCLNDAAPVLNFDLDLRMRDERCALVCLLRMCSLGKLLLTDFVYTTRVQLKRDEFGHMAPWGDSLSGVRINFMSARERSRICAELGVEEDILQVILLNEARESKLTFTQWSNSEHAPKQGRAQVLLQKNPL